MAERNRLTPDYTGFSSAEFRKLFYELLPPGETIDTVAVTGHMDARDLRKVLVNPESDFIGLNRADNIFLRCLGEDIISYVHSGDLRVIPAYHRSHARQMAEDEFWKKDHVPTEEELERRTDQLVMWRKVVLYQP